MVPTSTESLDPQQLAAVSASLLVAPLLIAVAAAP
jgi:hypothetical protein